MPLYWGDLHNHCAASYGRGTPRRALANARAHLDFCTITGHAFWPDMPLDLTKHDALVGVHLGGFAKLQQYWPMMLDEMARANIPGSFVTIPSYEWHSRAYGDHNCYFDADRPPLLDAPDLASLAQTLKRNGTPFMMLPHHVGYPRGYRGINWDTFDAGTSPLVEIFSNHGCGEADDAGYDYHHSMGPRIGESMVRQGLLLGHRFGFYASTDSHDGYPGHYGHGRVGVWTDRLERSSIWRSLRERRTIATTGASIAATMSLGDAQAGGVTPRGDAIELQIQAEAASSFDKIELIEGAAEGWRVRRLAVPDLASAFDPGVYKVKIEVGWGRGQTKSCWQINARVEHGKLLSVEPCFRYAGYGTESEEPTEAIREQDTRSVTFDAHALPNPSGAFGGTHFNAGGTQAVNLSIEADARTRLKVEAASVSFDIPIAELVTASVGRPVGDLGSAAIKINRAVPARECRFLHQMTYRPLKSEWSFLYLRLTQTDGQQAWLSPIWLEA